ncbi:cyclase family protein [Nesterenkonia sp. LB17]|nr:cyclase family protein [Nesterenkonia sp. YGD6]MCH8566322.1 cyclase family protein [Nesterenkonia sp. LB17]MCH8572073.1 cyclase family protein [Nesterenkonia sp. AY15]
MPVFPGDPQVSIQPAATVAVDGFEVHALHLGTHSGTHVDAPAHVIPGGHTVDAIDVEDLIGEAMVLRAGELSAGATVTLESVADQLAGGLGDARIVLVATGWDRHWSSERYLDHPVLEPTLAEHLLELGARVIGVDTLNPDSTRAADQGLPVHDIVLGKGRLIIENLRQLTQLPARVEFVGLPLRLPGMDGSPIRAVARPL